MAEARDFVAKEPAVHFLSVDDLSKTSTVDEPETFLFDRLKMRPRALSHHLSSSKIPSRLWLKTQANFWRSLMSIGMQFHDLAPPKPPKVSFVRKIPTNTIPIKLYFYTPSNYASLIASGHRFPVVVNFHGGGFCLGHATDDRYWARVLLERANAVVVSVDYRRAPEHPFPIPVDDSVASLLYLAEHADSLGLDTSRVALSGFSAGANLAFAAPLRMKYHTFKNSETYTPSSPNTLLSPETPTTSPDTPTLANSTSNLLNHSQTSIPLRIISIIGWYPLLDWTQSRSQKKRSSLKPSKTLPKTFTDLFDYSYLPPPDTEGDHCSPYASPGLAPDAFLRDGLPNDIQMWLCEWDMLLLEGQKFSARLEGLSKDVVARVIPGVPHGWDKSPNPWRKQGEIDHLYEKAAAELRRVFES